MVIGMQSRTRVLQWVLIAVVVAGLVADAIVHLDLASAFSNNKTSVISEADIFRIQSVVALVAAIALLVRPRRYTAAFAFLIAASAFAAVVVYRYVNIGKIGPIPNMYDPYWAPAGKNISAIAEVVAALAAAALVVVLPGRSSTDVRAHDIGPRQTVEH
jgi:glucan phosphoethanolaminetransferase (alkaline phosphatase superfamily)